MTRSATRDFLAAALAGVICACLWLAYLFLSPSVLELPVLTMFGRNFGGPNAISVSTFHLAYETVVALGVGALVVLPVGLLIHQRPFWSCTEFTVFYLCILTLSAVLTGGKLTDLGLALSLRSFWLFLVAGVMALVVSWNLRLAIDEA